MSLANYIRRVNADERESADATRKSRSVLRRRARVFVSYPRSTPKSKDALVDLLEKLGHMAVHDGQIPANRDFARWIEDEIDSADAVAVLWNARSIRSEWVRAEAMRAHGMAKLISIVDADVDWLRLPLPYAPLQALNRDDAAGLANAINALLARDT